MTTIDTYIGKRVREKRRSLKLTQEEVAVVLGMTRVSVNNMENGKQGFTVKSIFLLCSLLSCEPNDLFPKIKKARVSKIRKEKVITITLIRPELKINGLATIPE